MPRDDDLSFASSGIGLDVIRKGEVCDVGEDILE